MVPGDFPCPLTSGFWGFKILAFSYMKLLGVEIQRFGLKSHRYNIRMSSSSSGSSELWNLKAVIDKMGTTKLKFNAVKTKILLVSNAADPRRIKPVLNGVAFPCKGSCKVLRVFLDQTLILRDKW